MMDGLLSQLDLPSFHVTDISAESSMDDTQPVTDTPDGSNDVFYTLISQSSECNRDNMLQSTYEITDQVLAEDVTKEPTPGLPSKAQLAQNANHCRQCLHPKDPTTINFDLQKDAIPQGFFCGKHQNQEQPPPPVCK